MESIANFFKNLLRSFKSASPLYTWATIWIIAGNTLGLFVIDHFSPPGKIDFGQVAIWGLAIFLLGAVIGILFGVPKQVSSPAISVATQMSAAAAAVVAPAAPVVPGAPAVPLPAAPVVPASPVAPASQPNSSSLQGSTNNLTEISDWLTKIVLGAGLVQLKEIPHFVLKVAGRMALGVSLKPDYYSTGLCAAVIIYYLCFGLLLGYFVMRTIFTEIFSKMNG